VTGPAEERETEFVTIEGRRFRLRPIGPDDDDDLIEMGRRSTPDDLRLRFFSAVRPEPGPLISRLTHFDHDRQRAAGAYDPELPRGPHELLGVVRLHWEPDHSLGEPAIMVRSDFKGHGLGYCLMQEMLGWAEDLGLARVEGEVLPENTAMLHMVQSLGGVILPRGPDLHTVRVAFDPPRKV
jgi:acetyltransferase